MAVNLMLATCNAVAITAQSLDLRTGALDVDYPRYLAKHDLVFNQPITDPVQGATVGNGRVGAMVWNVDGIVMQISGVDASEQSAFSAGRIHFHDQSPARASDLPFRQTLSLYDGVLTARYGKERTITVMGLPNSEVLGIHVSESHPGVSPVIVDLSLWDVSEVSGGDVPDIASWRTLTTRVDATDIAIGRGQDDPNHFGYTLAATVQGAKFATELSNPRATRLVITPTADYTIWIACASRLNAPNHDSMTQAGVLLRDARNMDYPSALTNYREWWHRFWHRSFVQYSPEAVDGDYLENLYYLYTYVIAAGSYGNYPFHFGNGVFSAVGDANSAKWSVAYWYWNERDVLKSFLASNHPEILHSLSHLYTRNFEALKAHTRQAYRIEGLWVPETMRWDGSSRYTDHSDWTRDILSTGAEVAENMFDEYRYTDDATYLQSSAYPFMREVAQFYVNKLVQNAGSGLYEMPVSNAHETYWSVRNAVTDLAAVRSLFPRAIQASLNSGDDETTRRKWQTILDHLAPFPTVEDGSRYAPHDPPAAPNHNWENITSELIWPYGVTGIGAADFAVARASWMSRPFPYSNIWSCDAVQAARLGLGDEVLIGLRTMIHKYQSYSNGLTNDANGSFEYLGTHLSAINESLLQSHDDVIRVFPAVPEGNFVGRFTLLAQGGFLVSSEYADREIKYVSIKSLYGHTPVVENPWGTQSVRVRRADERRPLLISSARTLQFATASDSVYIIERTSRPLSNHPHQQIKAPANERAKRMAGSGSSVFLGT